MNNPIDLNLYKHKTRLTVRTFDIDSQGIVHNSVFLRYLETGRIEYRKSFGYKVNRDGMFDDGMKVMVVHNSIDYMSPSYADDELDVYTRILWIKKSSFCFDQVIVNSSSKQIICAGKGILVNLNPDTIKPEPIKEKFIEEIRNFETDLELIR